MSPENEKDIPEEVPTEASTEASTTEDSTGTSAPDSTEGTSEAEKPRARKPAVKKPAVKKPTVRKPGSRRKSAEQEPMAEEAPEEKATGEDAGEDATEGEVAEEKPAAKKSTIKKPAAEKPAAEEPAEGTSAKKPAPRARGGAKGGHPRRRVVRARARYVRTSARKARMISGHLPGRSVEEARAILAFAPREVARDWSKLLESAVANAENNHELLEDDLVVREAYADEGPTIKRFRPRAMGRATPIRKRTSHLTITLIPED
jgi:ribosomal protein L22